MDNPTANSQAVGNVAANTPAALQQVAKPTVQAVKQQPQAAAKPVAPAVPAAPPPGSAATVTAAHAATAPPAATQPATGQGQYRVTLESESHVFTVRDADEAWAMFCDAKKKWPSRKFANPVIERAE